MKTIILHDIRPICCGRGCYRHNYVKNRLVTGLKGVVSYSYRRYRCGKCHKIKAAIDEYIPSNHRYSRCFINMAQRLINHMPLSKASAHILKEYGVSISKTTLHEWRVF